MPDFSSTVTLTISEAYVRYSSPTEFAAHLQDEVDALAHDLESRATTWADTIRGEAGRVKFFRSADASFDAWTSTKDEAVRAFMREHYHRMRVNSPYFDPKLVWFPDALAYKDAYAIYVGKQTAILNPEWILRDPAGAPLYIPYKGRPYTQYAGDITNPAFRARWIEEARYTLALGYRGLVIDDVNYYRRVATASGNEKGVQIGASGVLTDALWRQTMADFMAEISAALPDAELIHNVKYYAPTPETPEVTRGHAQADWLEIELGVIDPGITGGDGKWSLQAILNWVDRRHTDGVGVVWDATAANTDLQREYQLACYFLVNNGLDMVGSRQGGTPGDWWAGWDTDLGAPLGPRLSTRGLYWRRFERGTVYVVEPGAASVLLANGRMLHEREGAVVADA